MLVKKTYNKWFETQDPISYYIEFEKEKIIYPNMTKYLPFVLDNKGFLTNQKCFILTSDEVSLKFLTGYFNSTISKYWIKNNCPELQGGTRELSKVFFERIPIPKISTPQQKPFIDLVDKILQVKAENQNANTTDLERQIDKLVYKLYELTEDEIELLEN